MISATSFSSYTCPHCFENVEYRVELGDGSSQEFSIDCEVCCRPILLKMSLDTQGDINIEAEKE
jgi:hypothetical protein